MPMDRRRYPADWEAISRRIRARDQQRCRFCGVPNHARGWRDERGCFRPLKPWEVPPIGRRLTIIVLTVAHLHDHAPMNVSDDNLISLCQLDHLHLDRDHHATNARLTRIRKRLAQAESSGQQQLFGETK